MNTEEYEHEKRRLRGWKLRWGRLLRKLHQQPERDFVHGRKYGFAVRRYTDAKERLRLFIQTACNHDTLENWRENYFFGRGKELQAKVAWHPSVRPVGSLAGTW